MKTMSTLVFFPWLGLTNVIKAGDFSLIPFERGKKPGGPGTALQKSLDKVTEPYIIPSNNPISYAAIVKFGPNEITTDISEEQAASVFAFSELVAISGLSARNYFAASSMSGYWNRENFRIFIQNFTPESHGVAVTTRRRDGSRSTYYSGKTYNFQKPEHVESSSITKVKLDTPLLDSLLKAKDGLIPETWSCFFESILNFNFANTDNDGIQQEAEAVFIIGAFERLLECGGKENDLAERFVRILRPSSDKSPNDFTRLSAQQIESRFRNSSTIRDIWIRDFYRLRGDLAHGKVESKYPAIWTLRDHLLHSSYVFPLVLKCKLAEGKYYNLTEDDQFHIDLFESLLCEEHFKPQAMEHEHPWDKVFQEARIDKVFRRPLKKV
jgi:hypothetical protein